MDETKRTAAKSQPQLGHYYLHHFASFNSDLWFMTLCIFTLKCFKDTSAVETPLRAATGGLLRAQR